MTRRGHHLSTAEKALTLIRIRGGADICTYLAINSADTSGLVADAAREFDGAEALSWGVLPGIRRLAARELGAAPGPRDSHPRHHRGPGVGHLAFAGRAAPGSRTDHLAARPG